MIVAWAPVTDEPTAVSRWLVERNAAMVDSELGRSVMLLGSDATSRETLEQALTEPAVVGLVAGGHGDRYRLHGGEAQPALDFDNASALRGLWAHLIACRCGESSGLAERLALNGATVVAAYEAPVHVGFEPQALDFTTISLLDKLVTVTTKALAEGWSGHAGAPGRPLPPGLHEAHDALLIHLDRDPNNEDFAGLNLFAQTLLARLRIFRRPND